MNGLLLAFLELPWFWIFLVCNVWRSEWRLSSKFLETKNANIREEKQRKSWLSMKKIQNALAKTKSKKLSNQACFLGTRKSKKIYVINTLQICSNRSTVSSYSCFLNLSQWHHWHSWYFQLNKSFHVISVIQHGSPTWNV